MIATDFHGGRNAGEQVGAVVRDAGRLAMYGARGAHDAPTVRLTDGLMPEADAEDRGRRAPRANDVHRDAGLRGRARTGREDDALGRELADFLDRHGVVAPDEQVRAQLA